MTSVRQVIQYFWECSTPVKNHVKDAMHNSPLLEISLFIQCILWSKSANRQ